MKGRKRGGLGVVYEVREDPLQVGKWFVLRGGTETGGFARDKSTAIGLAFSLASREANTTDMKVSVVSIVGSKRTIEWKSLG